MRSLRNVALAVLITLISALGLWGQALTFSNTTYATGGTGTNTVAVADFNKDGALDVVASNSTTAFANSSSANYTGWLGLLTSGLPTGHLQASGAAIPFFFSGDAFTDTDRALNVVVGRFPPTNGAVALPAIYGAGGGGTNLQPTTRGPRSGPPWNANTNAFVTGISQTPSQSPAGTHTSWVAAGDFNGDGIDDGVATHFEDVTQTATSDLVVYPGSVSFGSLRLSAVGSVVTGSAGFAAMPGGLTGFSVSTGDLDGDGKADVVVATNSNSIVIYRSTSTVNPSVFSFAAPVTIGGLAASSKYITVADVTGDHKLDIIIATGGSTVIVLPNNGSGGFSSGTAITLTLNAGNALSTAVADLSHDGIVDIAVADGANIEVFRGQGSNSFAAPVSYATGAANPVWVVSADMNADGKPDLIVASKSDNKVAVMLNSTTVTISGPGNLSFYAAVGGSNPAAQTASATFDIGGSATYTSSVSTGGTGNWLSAGSSTSGPVTVSVDITGLAANVYHGVVNLLAGPSNAARIFVTLNVAGPSGTLTSTSFPFANAGTIAGVADFNGDGKVDVVLYNGSNNTPTCVGIFTPLLTFVGGHGDGTFDAAGSQVNTCLSGGFTTNTLFASADFNGDGRLDVAMVDGNSGALQIAFGDGAGHFNLYPGQFSGSGTPTGVMVADMNNDGVPDVLIVSNDNTNHGHVNVFINDGTGKDFTTAAYAVGLLALGGAIADINGDGFLDVLIPNEFSNNMSYLPGTGNGVLGAGTTITTCNLPLSVAVGDFNLDGKLDFATGCNNTSNFEIFLGNGNGTFQAGSLIPTGGGVPQNLTIGDFDGDGKIDLFFSKQSQPSVSVQLGNGNGGFPVAAVDFPASSSSSTQTFFPVDVSGDGKLDVLYPGGANLQLRLGDRAATSTSVSSNPLTTATAGQNVAFTATINTTVPSWAKATGVTTINDTLDGQVGQGNAVAGAFTVNAALTTGVHSLSDTYAGDGRTKPSNSGSSYGFTVVGAHLAFTTQPVTTASGATMANIVVKVQDASNATIAGSTASITLTLSTGSFSAGATTVSAIAGVATFTGLKINATGTGYTITASANQITSAISNPFNITGGAVAQFLVAGYANPTVAGVAHSFTVTAQDAGANTITGYTGTVTFSSSDGQAVLPANYTFIAGDNGVHTFSGTLKTAGTQSITAKDFNNQTITGSQTGIEVQLGPPASITPIGTPQSAVVGQSFAPISVVVKDAGGNVLSELSVTFQAPAAGAACTFAGDTSQNAGTNGSGVATPATPLANFIAGSYTVTATINALSATFNLTNLADLPAFMNITGGDAQATAINTPFTNPLKVQVFDQFENLVNGAPVTFTAPGSGASGKFPGSLLSAIVNTDSNGVATSPIFSANGSVGNYQVVASTPGIPIQPGTSWMVARNRTRVRTVTGHGPADGLSLVTATFNLTNLTGSASIMTITAGNNQSVGVNAAYPTALQVKVTDAGLNPLSGLTVTFTAPSSGAGGTFPGSLSSVSVVTDSGGFATAPAFTAGTVAGSYGVSAAAAGLTQTFTESITPGPPSAITKFAGDNQSALTGQAFTTNLAAKVTDSFSNPIGGVAVSFTPPASGAGGAFTGPTTVNTLASGVATVGILTANATPGNFQVAAAVVGNPSLTVSFSESNLTGPPAFLTIVAGNNQSVTVGTLFPTNLGVKVTDAQLNPLANVAVTFTPPGSGASGAFTGAPPITVNTNASGIATAPAYTANTVAGSNPATAAAGALGATFTLTNQPDVAAVMTPSGTPQSAIISTAYGTALSVKITDQFGNAISGVSVLFTAPGSGASGTFPGGGVTATAITDVNGNAAAPTITANATTGAFTVRATGASLTATFNLTNTVTPIAGIVAFSGSGQLIGVNQPFGSPLVARVFDGNGNGVANASVTFTMPASGPSAGFVTGAPLTFTATTNSQGLVTTPLLTANNQAGTFNVIATTGALSATFVLTNGSPQQFLLVAPTLLIFYSEIGQPPPRPQFVNVQTPLQTYTFAVDAPWLKVSILPNGVLKDTLVVNVDPTGLPPGHYDGNIVINDGAAVVRADLQVLPRPQINPSATSLTFQYTQGQGIPSEQLVYVTAMTRNFNVTVTTNYVSPSGVTGWLKIIGDGTSTTPSILHVSIVPDTLPPGTYQANIHIVSTEATNSPFDIPVTLVVAAPSQ